MQAVPSVQVTSGAEQQEVEQLQGVPPELLLEPPLALPDELEPLLDVEEPELPPPVDEPEELDELADPDELDELDDEPDEPDELDEPDEVPEEPLEDDVVPPPSGSPPEAPPPLTMTPPAVTSMKPPGADEGAPLMASYSWQAMSSACAGFAPGVWPQIT